MDAIEKLKQDERGYPDRIEIGQEAVHVLADWYSKLIDSGYYIEEDTL